MIDRQITLSSVLRKLNRIINKINFDVNSRNMNKWMNKEKWIKNKQLYFIVRILYKKSFCSCFTEKYQAKKQVYFYYIKV